MPGVAARQGSGNPNPNIYNIILKIILFESPKPNDFRYIWFYDFKYYRGVVYSFEESNTALVGWRVRNGWN